MLAFFARLAPKHGVLESVRFLIAPVPLALMRRFSGEAIRVDRVGIDQSGWPFGWPAAWEGGRARELRGAVSFGVCRGFG